MDRITRVEDAVCALINALGIEWDDNTKDTPIRVARMLVTETLAGLFTQRPPLTVFPNTDNLDEIYSVGPITIRSCCAHHLVPIQGKAWIAVLPGSTLMGLSKFSRLAAWVMARPQIQENATVQLANEIEAALNPKGLAVAIKASHLCCTWRGVCDDGQLFTTSVMRGSFRNNDSARAEVLSLFRSQGF
jgi:GTP cyclohydrolase IA